MATFNELWPHAGAAWVRFCAIWADYVYHEDWTFATEWGYEVSDSRNFLKLIVTITKPAETDTYNLVFYDTVLWDGYGRHTMHYVGGLPGFASSPPVVHRTIGSRDTNSDWGTNCQPVRIQFVIHCTGHNEYSNSYFDGAGFSDYLDTRTYYSLFLFWAGSFVLVTPTAFQVATSNVNVNNGTNPNNALMVGSPGQASAGGGSVDVSGIVSALDQLALKDFDISINNGAAIFSVNGRARVA